MPDVAAPVTPTCATSYVLHALTLTFGPMSPNIHHHEGPPNPDRRSCVHAHEPAGLPADVGRRRHQAGWPVREGALLPLLQVEGRAGVRGSRLSVRALHGARARDPAGAEDRAARSAEPAHRCCGRESRGAWMPEWWAVLRQSGDGDGRFARRVPGAD